MKVRSDKINFGINELFSFAGEGGKTTLAVAVGRRVLLMIEESKTDGEMGFEYTHIKVRIQHPIQIKKVFFTRRHSHLHTDDPT